MTLLELADRVAAAAVLLRERVGAALEALEAQLDRLGDPEQRQIAFDGGGQCATEDGLRRLEAHGREFGSVEEVRSAQVVVARARARMAGSRKPAPVAPGRASR